MNIPLITLNWQVLINALPCFLGWCIGVTAFYFILRFVVSPLMGNCHERKMKELYYKQEKELLVPKEKKQGEKAQTA